MASGGTGLGLNIAYNGAQNILGGTLDFQSEVGKGTVFILAIPLVAPSLVDLPGEDHSGVAGNLSDTTG
jgi:signal transduction histidine kinase